MNVSCKYLKLTALALSCCTGVFFSSTTTASQSAREEPLIRKDLSLIAQTENPTAADRLFDEGLELYKQRTAESLRRAILKFEGAASLYRQEGDRKGQGKSLNNLGVVYESLGQYSQALEYYQQSLTIRKEIGDRNGQGVAFNNLGVVYSSLGQYRQALEYYQQSLTIAKEIGDRNGQGKSLNNLGGVYKNLSQYRQALEYYQQSLTIRKEIGDRNGEGITLMGLGNVYKNLGQYRQALEYYQQSLTIAKEIGDRKGQGDSLNNLGNVYSSLGQYSQALEYYQQYLTIKKEIGDRNGQGGAFNNLGNVYSSLGQYRQALEYYQQSLTIAKEIGDRKGQGNSLNNLGVVYESLGQYSQALEYYQQSLTIKKEIGDRKGQGDSLNNLGNVYYSLGQYSQALEYYQQSLTIAKEIGDRNGQGNSLNNLGNVYESLGQYSQALEYYQQSLAIDKEIGDRNGQGNSLHNLGNVYESLGQYSQALEYYQQSLTIAKEIGDRKGQGDSLNNLGNVYESLGQYSQALEYYQQSLTIRKEIGDRNGQGNSLHNIALLLEKQNLPQLAIVFYKQSVNVSETIRGDLKGLNQDLQQSYLETVEDSYRRLADLLLEQDRILEAQEVLDLLKIQELDDYLHGVRGEKDKLSILRPEREILAKYDRLQQSAISVGKELTRLRQIAENQRSPAQQQRIARLVNLEEDLNKQFNEFVESDEILNLVEQLSRTAQRQNIAIEDLASLRDNLGQLDNAVLLYPLILEDRLELIITTPNSPPLRRTVPVTRAELNRTIVQLRQALEKPNSDAKTPARQLYNWIIKPLEADLTQAEAKTIVYAPDAQLRYIPLSALYDGQQWLVQRFSINNITARSLTDFNRQPALAPRILAGAFADSNLSYSVTIGDRILSFKGLPFAGAEVETLAETVVGTTKLLDRNFSLAAIKPQMNEYNIVHFATHAAFLPGRPENSFILFGNGDRPSLKDIKNWSLQNVDLVVLSACETGIGGNLGKGQEILGLGYQFQKAGARAVIASLWQVDDGGTQVLMNAFYPALGQQNSSKAKALRLAQIALITGDLAAVGDKRTGIVMELKEGAALTADKLEHPYYWASFILIGNGL